MTSDLTKAHTQTFTAPLFTAAKEWHQLPCLSMDEWTNKKGVYSHNEQLAIRGNDVQIRATLRMNFENVILRERRQAPKATWCRNLFIENVQGRQIYRDGK